MNYLGCDSWYPAVYVQAINATTSKVRYVDGDQEEDVVNTWIRRPLEANTTETSSPNDVELHIATDATESHRVEPHHISSHLASSPQPDTLSSYINGQMSIPSTVTSIGAIGSDEDIQYSHKLGIGSDDVPTLTSYEVLHAIGRLHGVLAQKFETHEAIYSTLCSLAVRYYNEASSDAFEAGKTAFAMKCIEDASQYE